MKCHVPFYGRLRKGRVTVDVDGIVRRRVRTTSSERRRPKPGTRNDVDPTGQAYHEQHLPSECSTRLRDAMRRILGGVRRRIRSADGHVGGVRIFKEPPCNQDSAPLSTAARPQQPTLSERHGSDGSTHPFGTSTRNRTVSFNTVVKVCPTPVCLATK